MRVLWLCNIMLPVIAGKLGLPASCNEGWLTGLMESLQQNKEENGVEPGICFPVENIAECSIEASAEAGTGVLPEDAGSVPGVRKLGHIEGMEAYGFSEDLRNPERYENVLKDRLAWIVEDFKPDIVHCFGAEYAHTLAMTKVVPKEKILIGLQGLCTEIAKAYPADLPEHIQKRFLLRDVLRHDNIRLQQKKYVLRGEHETEAIKGAGHLAGRTAWDRAVSHTMNPDAEYHILNETLRRVFYEKRWQREACMSHRIFFSQGNYPLKGLHYLLWAMPDILKKYPDTEIYVAGDNVTRYASVKEKLKIGSYGKYLRDEIVKYGLEEKVHFLGRLQAEDMCDAYLKSELFVSASALENSPNSVGEAMLLGMPVVSSAVGGVESLMTHEKEGLLFKKGDTAALAEEICRLFGDCRLAEELGAAARARAFVTHDAEKNYRQLLEIYRKIESWQGLV